MKETGIIMSGNHPKLILDGIKTQTRRVIKPQPYKYWDEKPYLLEASGQWCFHGHDGWGYRKCPYGQVGDRLWVRETTWYYDGSQRPHYIASESANKLSRHFGKIKPSIHLFKKYARIWLEITEVRVERIQDISEKDAFAEGCEATGTIGFLTPMWSFVELWDSLNAKCGYGWETNPFVWVIGFKLLERAKYVARTQRA